MARDPRTFTPKKAGDAIGCSADTIRRYCALYARHLSEGARPEAGATRVLTATDVYLLRLAKLQTEAGASIEEIDKMLETVALPPEVEVEPEERSNLPAVVGELPEGVALLRQIASTLDKLEARDRRFDDFAGELADLRQALESRPEESPTAAPASGLTWSSPLVLVAVVAAAAVVVLTLAVVVALLR